MSPRRGEEGVEEKMEGEGEREREGRSGGGGWSQTSLPLFMLVTQVARVSLRSATGRLFSALL